MKKPYKHKCMDCGNVYYYRHVKRNKACPVCRGELRPEGYRPAEICGHMMLIPDIPPPPRPISQVLKVKETKDAD